MHRKNILMGLNRNTCKAFFIFLIICFFTSICKADLLNFYKEDEYSTTEQNFYNNNKNFSLNETNTISATNLHFNLNWQKLLTIGNQCSGIAPEILLAIILTESGGNPYAININGVKSFQPKTSQEALKIIYKYNNANVDIGLMQINYKTWAKVFNVYPHHLLVPEINICIGSQILRYYLDKHNWTWKGIGRYNASTTWKQANYAIKVSQKLRKIKQWWELQQQ